MDNPINDPDLVESMHAALDLWREEGRFNMFEAPRHLRTLYPGLNKPDSYAVFTDWTKKFEEKA
tara:strand:- start:1939 stop:2130 length:192 start_codon:yes stop_codon:yes gene_type:complete